MDVMTESCEENAFDRKRHTIHEKMTRIKVFQYDMPSTFIKVVQLGDGSGLFKNNRYSAFIKGMEYAMALLLDCVIAGLLDCWTLGLLDSWIP